MVNQRNQPVENRVLRILGGEREKGPICSSPLVTVTSEQMKASGSYYPAAHHDPQAMARLSMFAFTSIGFQGIRVPLDLCVEADALGCKMRNGGRKAPPAIIGKGFEEKDALLVPDDVFRRGRFPVVFEAIRILKDKFADDITIYAGMVGPLTLVSSIYDASTVMRWPTKEPQRMDDNLGRAADFLAEYARRLFEVGGDVLSILDPAASGDLVSRKYFQRHIMPAYRRIREEIEGPVVLHICGNTEGFLDLIPETRFEAFSFEGPKVSVATARQKIGDKMVLVGNIPTYDILLFGTPENVREESLKALRDGVDLLSPGCGVPVQTPTENLKAMVRAVEEFRKKGK